jgi:hypothetical protein
MNPSAAAGEPVANADRRAALGVWAGTFALYLLTAPRTVVLEDDGYFLQAAWFNAVAHPPGYPLYVALAHVATLIPAGSVALRVHGLTGLFAALACMVLYRLARRLSLGNITALAVALAFGCSEAFWSQSIIADVYSLNVLLALGAAWLCLGPGDQRAPITGRNAALLGLCYGLGLSNHWPLLILSSPMLLLLAWPARAELWRAKTGLVMGLAAGLLPYLWMIWRTHVVPDFCFAGPIESWRDFHFYVGREGYANVDRNVNAGWWDRVQFAGFVLHETARQFSWLGAALGLLGLIRQWQLWPRRVCWALVLGFLGSSFLLILALGFDFDDFHRNTFRVYPLISYAVYALWIGVGLEWMSELWRRRGASGSVLTRPEAVLAVLLVGVTGLLHWPANYRATDNWAEIYGRTVLATLPEAAVLYANADTVSGPVGYLHYVEGLRPDVMLVNGHSLRMGGKLFRPYALSTPELRELIAAFIASTPRPIFYSNDFPNANGADFFGLYFQVHRDTPGSVQRAALTPLIADYFQGLDRVTPPSDPWENMHYRLLRQDQCRLLAAISGPAIQDDITKLPAACRGLYGRLLLAQQALTRDGPGDARFAFELLRDSDALRIQAIWKADATGLEALRAVARARLAGAN